MLSPHGVGGSTEDSFQHFMSRMVQQYVREEELRARHQATLLELRENALKEKTKVSGCGGDTQRIFAQDNLPNQTLPFKCVWSLSLMKVKIKWLGKCVSFPFSIFSLLG
jgi:centrosomal protein CEP350